MLCSVSLSKVLLSTSMYVEDNSVSLGNRVAIILGKSCQLSAGQLFILRLLNCIFLSFPLVFGVRCGSDCISSLSSLIHFA